ncbi:MAG TPA: DUF5343 domain-containing protein [Dehalococcoidales bacterium]|nr:DUF5343 domain-containing protein [Dehalococcoidales bacterium]
MSVTIPFINKPQDVLKLLEKMQGAGLPSEVVDAAFIKNMGFSASSAAQLAVILKQMGFLDDNSRASSVWAEYISTDDRAKILGRAIKTGWAGLFGAMMCPYLADDAFILEYFKNKSDASARDMENSLATFRLLCELADFQDLMSEWDSVEPLKQAIKEAEDALPQVKVDPNLQLNIQIHIHPDTSDEKIETIFKSMRKYLLGKE